jgi:hypothetical protein
MRETREKDEDKRRGMMYERQDKERGLIDQRQDKRKRHK